MTQTLRKLLPALVLSLLALPACSHTILVVQTEPAGADVQDRRLGFLGQTPLRRELTSNELDRLGPGLALELDITKKDFVADRALPVMLNRGDEIQIKRELVPRLPYIEITSEPDGVAVFHLFVDPRARDYDSIKDMSPDRVAQERPEAVVRRFLGNTPLRFEDDPEHPIEHNDILIYEKAGYRSVTARFKATERRLHEVMQPENVKER